MLGKRGGRDRQSGRDVLWAFIRHWSQLWERPALDPKAATCWIHLQEFQAPDVLCLKACVYMYTAGSC